MSKLWRASLLMLAWTGIALSQNPPAITSPDSPLPTGVVGQSYGPITFAGTGVDSIGWSATGLPAGLSIASFGQLSGTPTQSGTFSPVIRATTFAGVPNVTRTYSLTINPALAFVTTSPLVAGSVGTNYNFPLATVGGLGPINFFQEGGTLPPGLTVTSAGVITGTPTTTGVYTFTVFANDSNEPQSSISRDFTLSINNGLLAIATGQNLPRGVEGTSYGTSLQATGGLQPYLWTRVVGAGTGLPTGVNLQSNGGVVGTLPAGSAGTYTFRATVADAEIPVQSSSADFTLIVNPTLVITPTPLPNGQVNAPYTASLASTGGQPTVAWSLAAGPLPNGVTLNPNGTFTGTPTQTGVFPITVRATDSGVGPANQVKTQALSITITNPPLTITTISPLSPAVQNRFYSALISATGGQTPYTWSVIGSLPAGLALNPSTGTISGTPTVNGAFTLTIQVQDSTAATAVTQQRAFQLTIDPPLAISTPSPLPRGIVGIAYSQTFAAVNGEPPYTNWSGTPPAGLSLNPSTGALTGTPTAAGTFTFSIAVQDSSMPPQSVEKQFSLTIDPPLTISTASPLPAGVVGVTYSQTFGAINGTSPYTNWTVVGALPAGLALNPTTGAVTGTPTTAGTSTFTIQVRDSGTPQQTAEKSFSLTIAAGLTISTPSPLPDGRVGAAYNQTLAAVNGTAPYTNWSGTPPAGLSLNPATGALTGTPTTFGTFTFNVQVRDSSTPTQQNAQKALTITIRPAQLQISSTSPLTNGQINTAYNFTFASTGGTTSPRVWTAPGLPAGLFLNASTGVLFGTPTVSGSFTFDVRVQDSNTSFPQTANASFTLTIAPEPFLISTTSLPAGIVGTPYSRQITAIGGVSPYVNWTIVQGQGQAPPGITLNPTTGILSGTSNTGGAFTFTVRVQDSSPQPFATTKQLTLVISGGNPLSITTPSPLPPGTVATIYSQTLIAAGGTPPYAGWALSNGTSLPPGLSIASNGIIGGTPTAAGQFDFEIQVHDSGTLQQTQTKVFSLLISGGPPRITTSSPLPSGAVNTSYSQQLAATGGTPGYLFSLAADTLPQGLSLASNGLLSGIPTQSATSTFDVRVTDSQGLSSVTTFVLFIDVQTPTITTLSPLPNGVEGQLYTRTFLASGGLSPYRWNFEAPGSLPPGLTLASNGVLSGTPSQRGSYSFTVAVTDQNQTTARKVFALIIDPGAPTITTSSLPNGQTGVGYTATLAAAGGVPPYNFGPSAGTLPPGLAITSAGAVQGTPTTAGTFAFTARVTDSQGVQGAREFTVVIIPPSPPGLTITTPSLSGGTVGQAYSASLSAAGGVTPYTWSIASGALPGGISLNTATGALTGTPTQQGTFNFTARVSDLQSQTATKAFIVAIGVVAPRTLTITTASPLPAASMNMPYTVQFAAAGGVAALSWSLSSGALPSGLTLGSSGLMTGSPTTSGQFSFTVRVAEASTPSGSPLQAEKAFTLQVITDFPVITTVSLPPGVIRSGYAIGLTAVGGTPPYTWAITAGGLPEGFSFMPSGQIAGNSTAPVSATFTVRLTDATGRTAAKAFTLVINEGTQIPNVRVEVATGSMPEGAVGRLYALSFAARNGSEPFRWGFSGLPPGVEGRPTGEIIGTPERSGTFAVTATVTDDTGAQSSSAFNFVVRPAQVAITTERLGDGRVDTPYSTSFAATGGIPAYAFSVLSGTLPEGLSLLSNGTLTGTPTQAGTFSFSIQAADQSGERGQRGFSLRILPPVLMITTNGLPNGLTGVIYGGSLAATGGVPPYRWSATGLPEGLSVNADTGAISGAPTNPGQFGISVEVRDAENQVASKSFAVQVTTNILITTLTVGNMIVGTPVSVALAAAGGREPYAWTVTAGGLPPGTSLGGDGIITGTPTDAGDYNFTVQVTDANGATGTKLFPARVVLPLAVTTETLPPAPFGVAVSQVLAATGGIAPYTWSVFSGQLPPGLSLSPNGEITGTSTAAGTFAFTARVTDSGNPQQTRERNFSLQIQVPDVSGVTLTLPTNPQPGQQGRIGLSINSPYPLPITGTLTLTFAPNAINNADDQAIQFSTGGRTAQFTIAAGQTQAVFPGGDLQLQIGTTAGTITLTSVLMAAGAQVNCNCQLSQTIVIPRTSPAINSVRVQRTANGFTIVVMGSSSTREITQGLFRFAGTNLQATEFTMQLGPSFTTWFQSPQGTTYGGQFTLTVPFTIQGNANDVTSVTVTLSNTVGGSTAATANF